MFDFAWSELAVIILVAALILGPKELPKAMRTVAQFTRKARKMAGEFQGHWNEMVRESELEEVKNAVTRVATTDVKTEVSKFIDPTGEFGRELTDTISQTRTEIETAAKIEPDSAPQTLPAAEPAATTSPATPTNPSNTQLNAAT